MTTENNDRKLMIGRPEIEVIALRIRSVHNEFAAEDFIAETYPLAEKLELKARCAYIAEMLRKYLPDDFEKSAEIITASLPEQYPESGWNGNEGFHIMPLADFIMYYGLDDFDASMKACGEITKRFTSEFLIRPFIEKYPDETYEQLKKWAVDDNVHIRRLVSEGVRPRLPWAKKLDITINNPEYALSLLRMLWNDEHRYVRRSVGNCINDISKDNPADALKIMSDIKDKYGGDAEDIIRRGARTLINKNNKEALNLMGFSAGSRAEIKNLSADRETEEGGGISMKFEIVSPDTETVRIDYVVYYPKTSKNTRTKRFRLKEVELEAKTPVKVRKKHPVKPLRTRPAVKGVHKLEILINSEIAESFNFEVK